MKKHLAFIVFLFGSGCMFLQPDYVEPISAADLKQVLQQQDVFLLDVHIPEQKHIKGTDAHIPFNDIESYQTKLPADKNAPIYIYCEGGPMGNAAARTLHDLGYTRLFNLEGGAHAWQQAGYEFE